MSVIAAAYHDSFPFTTDLIPLDGVSVILEYLSHKNQYVGTLPHFWPKTLFQVFKLL